MFFYDRLINTRFETIVSEEEIVDGESLKPFFLEKLWRGGRLCPAVNFVVFVGDDDVLKATTFGRYHAPKSNEV